jgi:hypothetical protein
MKSFKILFTTLAMLGIVMGGLESSEEAEMLLKYRSISIPLINRNMEEYHATMKVGEPDQKLTVVFDTAMNVKVSVRNSGDGYQVQYVGRTVIQVLGTILQYQQQLDL